MEAIHFDAACSRYKGTVKTARYGDDFDQITITCISGVGWVSGAGFEILGHWDISPSSKG